MAQVALKKKDLPAVDQGYAESMGLDAQEWQSIINALGRSPNEFEIAMFSLLWAEDNSNKSSDVLLNALRSSQKEIFQDSVIYSPRSEHRFIDLGDGRVLCQVLGHCNADTASTPAFGGALTLNMVLDEFIALGGVPLAFVDLLRLGDHERPKTEQTIQQFISGLSRYTNIYGVPLSNGDTYFHSSYNNGTIANIGVLGIIDKKNLTSRLSQFAVDSPIVCLGYKTAPMLRDRNGKFRAARLADPYMEQLLTNLFLEAFEKGLISEIAPMTRGGVVKASFMLAGRTNRGVRLIVEKIPTEARNESPMDTILNQSGGRFLVVTTTDKHRALSDHFSPHGIDCSTVGMLTDGDDVELIHNHLILGNAPYSFGLKVFGRDDINLIKTAPMLRHEEVDVDDDFVEPLSDVVNLDDVWIDVLANPNLCSKQLLFNYFDEKVGASCLINNGADATVIALPEVDGSGKRGMAITVDSNSLYAQSDAYLGAVHSIAEGMQNLACLGVRPQGLSFCLNIGDPSDPIVRGQIMEATRAIDDASIYWKIPILSEAVSNTIGANYYAGALTPGIMMFGMIPDTSRVPSTGFQETGDKVFVLGETANNIACSEYATYAFKQVSRNAPELDMDEQEFVCTLVSLLVREQVICQAHDLSSGGLGTAIVEASVMRPGKPIGVDLEILATKKQINLRREVLMFGETPGRFIVSCKPDQEQHLRDLCREYGVRIAAQGVVKGKDIRIRGICSCSISSSTARRIWGAGLNHLFAVAEES